MSNLISFDPSTFSRGLLDDQDVQIQEARWDVFDYDGGGPETVALRVAYDIGESEPFVQHYSAGKPEDYAIVKEGTGLKPAGSRKSLSGNSNAALWIESVVNCGFPADKIADGDISTVDGLKCHVRQMPQPKRPGLKQEEGERERTILLVDHIAKGGLPWEQKGKGKATTTKAKTKSKAAAGVDEDEVDALAQEAVSAVLEGSDGTWEKGLKALGTKVFAHLKASPAQARKAAMQLAVTHEFLGGEDRPWAYDEEEGLLVAE